MTLFFNILFSPNKQNVVGALLYVFLFIFIFVEHHYYRKKKKKKLKQVCDIFSFLDVVCMSLSKKISKLS